MTEIVHVSESASWDDIRQRFAGQWVMLVALDWRDDDGADVRTAFVAGHGETRRQARAMARPLLAMFDAPGFWQLPLVRQVLVERIGRRYMAQGDDASLAACSRLL